MPILRVTAIEPGAVTLSTGNVSLRRFSQRPGEVLEALRLAVGEVATRDYLRRELGEIRDLLADLREPAGNGPDEKGTRATHRQSKKKG